MRIRFLALALVALIGLTAFAPAPFIKPDRKKGRDADLLAQLQGTWSIARKERMGPNGQVSKYSTMQKIRIEKGLWQFVSAAEGKRGWGGGGVAKGKAKAKGGLRGINYEISLTRDTFPQGFRLRRTSSKASSDYMTGILRVEGDTVKILYRLGSADVPGGQRPVDFETIPEGWYLLILKHDR